MQSTKTFPAPFRKLEMKLWNSAKENRDRREKVQLVVQLVHEQKLYVTDLSDVTHAYPLRHAHRRPPQTRTNYGTQTMEYQVGKALNNIKDHIDFNN
ncbi:MAG: hypothetical protein O7D30_10350, partial [Rickettsia endosymbiont of Ixodes persulcatus]|nr:hypothetical protein [Rickettsia endosymbiont of Ixodes persulcatus]